MAGEEKEYELRRGYIELIDSRTGLMRCTECGRRWLANIRPSSGGKYHRGAWTCHNCGANSKGTYSARYAAG